MDNSTSNCNLVALFLPSNVTHCKSSPALFKISSLLPLSLPEAVQDKLDQMVFLWSDIQALQEDREAKLLDVMDLADKFWCDHCALIATIKDSQDLLRELEKPGVDPSVVKQQQEFVEVGQIQKSRNKMK